MGAAAVAGSNPKLVVQHRQDGRHLRRRSPESLRRAAAGRGDAHGPPRRSAGVTCRPDRSTIESSGSSSANGPAPDTHPPRSCGYAVSLTSTRCETLKTDRRTTIACRASERIAHRAETHATTQVPVGQIPRQGDDRTRRKHDEDVFGDRLEVGAEVHRTLRSEEHTSELQSLMRSTYAVF